MLKRLPLTLLFVWVAFGVFQCHAITVTNLTCNGRANPLGIGTNDISFSWACGAVGRGVVQSAYQIRVGTTDGGSDVWDFGLMSSNRQTDVTLPGGILLAPATRYYWQVRVQDGNAVTSDWSETAWFETGLLTATDWAGAGWITKSIQSPDLTQWSNQTVTVEFTLHNEAFGVLLRSSTDAQNAYMFQVNVAGANPVFKPHERNNGTYTVLSSVDLSSFGYSNASLVGTTNTLQFVTSGTTITTFLNGIQIHSRTDSTFRRGVVGFRTFGTEAASVHRVQVVKAGGGTLIDPVFSNQENGFSGGTIVNGSLFISGTADVVFGNYPSSLPLLRSRFVVTNAVASARVYASAQGLYEVSINGQKAGDQSLAPGWTDYDQRIQAQTYDVTSLIQPGTNAIGVALADGWYRGKVGLGWKQAYGSELACVAKVKVTYTNGSSQWYSTDLNWKAGDGPYVSGDLQDGEIYHANLEKTGWDTVTFNDSQWTAVGTVASASSRLVPQPDEPVRAISVLTATNRTQPVAGKWIYDLGQNMVGVPRIQMTGTNGQTVTIRHGEELYRVGAQAGQLYTANLRTAKATDTYTFATNGTVTYQPKFTQHGFRYIEISGVITPPGTNEVQGVVLSSDLPGGGDLQTSNPMLNNLVSNIRWGQRGNFLSVPTDTPARDERLGWTGDINVFSPAAARYKDTRAFLGKWMSDVRDAQKANGNIPAVVPQPVGAFDDTGVGWADAVITVPYSVWMATGDRQILRANWTAMKAFYGFVSNSATVDGDLLEQGRSNWFSGDWLSLESESYRLEEHKVIATAYFAENTRMMAEMATVMGEAGLAAQLAALVPHIRTAFVAAYRSPDGSIYTGSQTAYAMALGLDMITDPTQRAQTAAKFVSKLAADNNHLKTGFLGTPWLLPALSKIGRDDLSMRLLLNEDYPSWGFPVTIGATTMWERWNSIQPDLTFGPVDMNSFNHYAYGAVGDWMFGNLGGILALEPGYKQSRIAPLVGSGGLTHGNCFQRTPFGQLTTAWDVSNGICVLTIEIPVNATAIVHVPTKSGTTVYEGAVPAETASGVQSLGTTNGTAVYAVGSGTYAFTSTLALNAPIITGAVPGMNQVGLTWSPSLFATSYNIKRSSTPGGPYLTVASNLTSSDYTDATVNNGVTYYYVVSAVNPAGESGNSFEVSATPQAVANFGFETPSVGTYQYSPSNASWTFTAQAGNNGSGITANGSLFNGSNPTAPQGTQVAFLQSVSIISQSISGFLPGAKYAVTFSAAQRAGIYQQSRQTWDLKADGSLLASYSPPATATNYVDYTTNFTATATTHTLSFVGTDLLGGDNTVFLDNVRIAPAPSLTPVQLTAQLVGGQLQLHWPVDHLGWRLEVQTNAPGLGLGTNWVGVPGSSTATNMVLALAPASGSVFCRLAYP
jgi:alpha-L-rhamnosidase